MDPGAPRQPPRASFISARVSTPCAAGFSTRWGAASARWRLTWILPFNVFVVVLLVVAGRVARRGRSSRPWRSRCVGAIVRRAHLLDAPRSSRSCRSCWASASYFVLVATTGGLASPLLMMGCVMMSRGGDHGGRAALAAPRGVHRLPRWASSALAAALADTALGQLVPPLADAAFATPEYVSLALLASVFAMMGVYRMGCTMTHGYERAALELAERREELCTEGEDRTRALEGMAARLAHEVKNPLAAIKGLSTHMARNATDPKTAERLAIVAAEADRLQASSRASSPSRAGSTTSTSRPPSRTRSRASSASCSRRAPRRPASRIEVAGDEELVARRRRAQAPSGAAQHRPQRHPGVAARRDRPRRRRARAARARASRCATTAPG